MKTTTRHSLTADQNMGNHSINGLLPNVRSLQISHIFTDFLGVHCDLHSHLKCNLLAKQVLLNFSERNHLREITMGHLEVPMWTLASHYPELTHLKLTSCQLKEWTDPSKAHIENVDPNIFFQLTHLTLLSCTGIPYDLMSYLTSVTAFTMRSCLFR